MRVPSVWVLLIALFACGSTVRAQSTDAIDLIVQSGRPIRVALAESVTVKRVGQTVTATTVEPVYVYDRIVIPAGTRVNGRIGALVNPSKASRARAMLGGDFSPHRVVQLQFESLVRGDALVPITTVAKHPTVRVKRQVARDADESNDRGIVTRAKRELKTRAADAVAGVKQQASDAIAAARSPGRLARLKEWAVDRLPYHPQMLRKDMVYDAELQAALPLGTAIPRAQAPQGAMPAPASVLSARLITTLDSAKASRGAPLEAVLTQPVFAEDGRLIFPEGTAMSGEVTFARPARRFHRNGQLRFLFERVQPPEQDSAPLLASLHAIDASQDDRLVLDDEGGASTTNAKTRFIMPALAILALRASADQGEGRGFEQGATNVGARATHASVGGNPLARGLGGFIGFGLIGVGLAQISRPLGTAFSAVGVARSVYTAVVGKGQDVHFQADTPIEVRLAPARPDGP